MDVPLPKHMQITEALIRQIGAGRLAEGQRLAPERQMAGDWDVSVGTVRKALAELAGQGLIRRVQGSGNYVCRPARPVGIYAFFRLERPEGGGLPTAEVIAIDRVAGANRIRRVRRLDGAAVAVEEILLDAAMVPDLGGGDLSESLYRHYAQAFGVIVARVEDSIGTGETPGWAGPHLSVGTCGLVQRRALDGAGQQVETSTTWFDSARARYVNRMSQGTVS